MSDLEQLRHLADRVIPPPYEAITAAARRRDRRSAGRTVAVAVSTVGLAVAGFVVVRGLDSAVPEPIGPIASPTPTPSEESTPSERTEPRSRDSMTPKEVVTAPDAVLETVAVAPGDSDVRVSMWHALCRWCPETPDGRGGFLGPPTFTGMALTADGYETATYARQPFSRLAVAVHSPRDDAFLVVDLGNGREWLVDLDGTVRRVERIDHELRPADPRLWFECARAGGVSSTWCSLDPDTATAYPWPEGWSGSAVAPNSGERPWGWSMTDTGTFEDPGGILEAWWDDDGSRHHRQLATDVMGGAVIGSPSGELTYWSWRLGGDTVDLHTGRGRGATWGVRTRAAPGFNRWVQMTRSPDGALLAWTVYPHLVVWRAEASEGGFHRVHEASGPELAGAGLWTQDGLVYANGSGTAALSEDGGRTWRTIENWR